MEKNNNKLVFLLADDHSMTRHGLELIVKKNFLNSEVHHASNLQEVQKYVSSNKIDILILDINFPDGDSISVMPKLLKKQPSMKILIFSAYDEDYYALRYIDAGAVGYLDKVSNEEEIKQAIDNIIIKGKHISQNVKDQILDLYISKNPINPLNKLSNREFDIAKYYVEGYGNLEIASKLQVKQNTISTLKKRVFQKLNITSISELIELFKIYQERDQ